MITVGQNGDFTSINEAVQMSKNGDTIFINTTIYCHMADSIMSSNNNADSDPDGLIIKR